jgi:hypothetical protein
LQHGIFAVRLRPLRCRLKQLLEESQQGSRLRAHRDVAASGCGLQPLEELGKALRVAQRFEEGGESGLVERSSGAVETVGDDGVPLPAIGTRALAQDFGVIDFLDIEVGAAGGGPGFPNAALSHELVGRTRDEQQQRVPVEQVGGALHAKDANQPVMHQPGELDDGRIRLGRCPTVNGECVGKYRDLDVVAGEQPARGAHHSCQ